jgi:hypothetical protein
MMRTLQVPRSRGGISGALLVLLGLWGALIPFIGPYFDYAYAPPSNTWNYTNARLIFEILPGVATAIGGFIILTSAHRVLATLGGWLAALGGAWYVVGVPLSATWDSPSVGSPTGGTTRQVLEYLGFFGGLGVVIVFLAAFALGRFAVVGVREALEAEDARRLEEARRSDEALAAKERTEPVEPIEPAEPDQGTTDTPLPDGCYGPARPHPSLAHLEPRRRPP